MFNEINVNTLSAFKSMVDDHFLPATQKEQAKFFGVGESTLSTWITTKKFPEYAKIIMNLMVEKNDLQELVNSYNSEYEQHLPVEIDDKVHIIKLHKNESAIYSCAFYGEQIASCNLDQADNVAYIIDAIDS